MIGSAIRTDIESWVARRDDNPVFVLARAGRFRPTIVARYIASVTYMIQQSPLHMRRAHDRARERGNVALAEHYARKLDEELGHEAWGQADLESLTARGVTVDAIPTAATERFARRLLAMIDDDPALYLCYQAFAEYVTVLLGPELLSLIEERNGVGRSSMTVIDKHIELDQDHADEAWRVIDHVVPDPRALGPMRAALAEVIDYFDAFSAELAAEERGDVVPAA